MKLTTQDYFTSSGRYPERAESDEITPEIRKNAEDYVERLNLVLDELEIKDAKFSSGFRPSSANARAKGAKKSGHMRGVAGDLQDWDDSIDKKFADNLAVLEKHGIYLEDPRFTKRWAHTQSNAPRSGNRVFIP